MQSRIATQEINPVGSSLPVSGNKAGDNEGAGGDLSWSQERYLLSGSGQKGVVSRTLYMKAYSYIRKGQA
ncbi:MAG: hypothetical protein N3G18_08385 [Candidatus Saccharicenans sp.]|nr:hypothetical protein [Candidatus Saccharicenans sp.]